MGNTAASKSPSTGISDTVLLNGTMIEEHDSRFHRRPKTRTLRGKEGTLTPETTSDTVASRSRRNTLMLVCPQNPSILAGRTWGHLLSHHFLQPVWKKSPGFKSWYPQPRPSQWITQPLNTRTGSETDTCPIKVSEYVLRCAQMTKRQAPPSSAGTESTDVSPFPWSEQSWQERRPERAESLDQGIPEASCLYIYRSQYVFFFAWASMSSDFYLLT